MDLIDRAILGEVSTDGRVPMNELADRVHLGASATRERLRRLERTVIRGYTTMLDPALAGFPIEAVVEVDLPPGADGTVFERALRNTVQVVEALHATGAHDYLLRLRCASTVELQAAVHRLKADHGAARTCTSVVLAQPVRSRHRLP